MIKDIIKSFKHNPLWTLYSLVLAPVFYILLGLTAITLGLINLSVDDTINFWNENT